VRDSGFPSANESGSGKTATKATDANTQSDGGNGASGEDTGQRSGLIPFRGDGNSAQSDSGGDARLAKLLHAQETKEMPPHISADPSRAAESSAPAGPDTVKTAVLQQNEFLSRATERNQFQAHVSADSIRVADSKGPAVLNTAKPDAPRQNEFLSQVAERVQILIRDGGDSVRIRLQPDQFGQMEIRAESTSRGMNVRILAETESVKNILEHNIPALQQNLHDLGVKVDRIQVMQDLFDSQSNTGHSSKSGNPGQGENRSTRNFLSSGNRAEDKETEEANSDIYRHWSRFHTVA
jgi:flagellar hook-length control protein FliK